MYDVLLTLSYPEHIFFRVGVPKQKSYSGFSGKNPEKRAFFQDFRQKSVIFRIFSVKNLKKSGFFIDLPPKSVWAITFEPPHPKNRPNMHQKAAKSSFPTRIWTVDGVAGLGVGPSITGWAGQQFWSELFSKKNLKIWKFLEIFGTT